MYAERTLWLLSLLLTGVVAWHTVTLARQEAATAAHAAAASRRQQRETIFALQTALDDAHKVTVMAERARLKCEEGLGLAKLRESWIERTLGLQERRRKYAPY